MWESQVLLTDGQVVFLRVLRFSPTFDERSARYKWNILERAVKPKSKKKKKKKKDPLWKHAYSNTLKCYHQKNENFQIFFFLSFSYFCSKHRLWVLVRTASARRFKRVPTIYVFSRNKKNNVYPCKPQFYYIKVGFKLAFAVAATTRKCGRGLLITGQLFTCLAGVC